MGLVVHKLVEEINVQRDEIEQLRREEEAMCDCVGVFLRAMVKDTSIPDHEMRVYGVDDESTKLIWALMMIQRPSAWKAKIDNCLPKIIANEMRKPVKRSHRSGNFKLLVISLNQKLIYAAERLLMRLGVIPAAIVFRRPISWIMAL